MNTPALKAAHVGISIFEPATNSYWYNYQGDKYFVPASNTKIPTCYAAMKYLGDSLVGLKYGKTGNSWLGNKYIFIDPSGDPTFLLDEFKRQPVFDFLQTNSKNKEFGFLYKGSSVDRWGNGWSWNDYDQAYMAERSVMPLAGNVITIRLNEPELRYATDEDKKQGRPTRLFTTGFGFFDSMVNNQLAVRGYGGKYFLEPVQKWKMTREIGSNIFNIEKSNIPFSRFTIPFVTNNEATAINFLQDTLKKRFGFLEKLNSNIYFFDNGVEDTEPLEITINDWHTIHSQPTDSLLKPMMHRSDNFFAEQALLMVSNEKLGVMNDDKIIDTLLKTDFKDLPQKPRWADGSGLSRYNLFTPQDMVAILHKMKNEFGMERLKVIFPTGGEGTISNYYKSDSGYIYGKTGTLSGVVAFSGFMYTKKGKLLVFSTLVNNHRETATAVRRAIETFLQAIRAKY
ncbi:MAG: D-alanyl-D-alanine carboxypeptidase [Bacteroidetes bacterium]|nr:D-alanyl-D-alanine carboxypeptidase [Bacteroidota bacterium]